MTKEEKQLLLTDLCGRLPYGVKVKVFDNDILRYDTEHGVLYGKENMDNDDFVIKCHNDSWVISCEGFKSYLRPIDSMSIEELEDYAKHKFAPNKIWEITEFRNARWFLNVKCKNRNDGGTWIFQVKKTSPLEDYNGIDWLNAHHFDYRGLIEKGLALQAPEGMYKFSDNTIGNE